MNSCIILIVQICITKFWTVRSIFWNKAPKKTLIQVLPAKLLLIVGGSWHSQHQLSSCTSSKLPANHYHLFFWSSLCSEKEANFAQRDSDFIFIFSQVWVVTRGTNHGYNYKQTQRTDSVKQKWQELWDVMDMHSQSLWSSRGTPGSHQKCALCFRKADFKKFRERASSYKWQI